MATKKPSRYDRSGPLRRLPSVAISTADAVLQAAVDHLVPDDQTQRKAFDSLMPYLYALRLKGCSWGQVTTLLTKSGFILQPSTVREYYCANIRKRKQQVEIKLF